MMAVTMSTALQPPPSVTTLPLSPAQFEERVGSSVAGWLDATDVRAFRAIDAVQRRVGTTGDILEIGAFMGRSAILLGSLLRSGETLVVNDLWDDLSVVPGEWDCIDRPAARTTFEANYLRYHPTLPRLVSGSSTTVLDDEVAAATCRLVHVDGSHEREIVAIDLATARRVSGPGGVMVFDDHMNPRHPGVTAAVWGAVDRGELRPLVITAAKLYAVGRATELPLDSLAEEATGLGLGVAHRRCCGHDTLRFELPAHRASAWVPPALKPALRAVRRAVTRHPG
jgi:hypothetical protein